MRETWVRSPGWEDSLEKEIATHSSTLACKIPWMEEHGMLQSMGSQRVRHDWVTLLTHLLTYICHSFSSKEQTSFNFMAEVTVSSDFGPQESKTWHWHVSYIEPQLPCSAYFHFPWLHFLPIGICPTLWHLGFLSFSLLFTLHLLCVCTLSHDWLFVPYGLGPARLLCPWDCLRQECFSGLPFHSPGDLPNPRIKFASLALASGFFITESPGKPLKQISH